MGLLDYYRQFEGMSEEEVNAGLREQAAERKRKALREGRARSTSRRRPGRSSPTRAWWSRSPTSPGAGSTATPTCGGSELRNVLAERHGVEPERLILGNGAAELLSAATRALIEPGQRLLTPWPSYPLFPLMARRAHGRPERVAGGR